MTSSVDQTDSFTPSTTMSTTQSPVSLNTPTTDYKQSSNSTIRSTPVVPSQSPVSQEALSTVEGMGYDTC